STPSPTTRSCPPGPSASCSRRSMTTEEPDDYLIGHVRETLAHDPRVNEMNIEVAVSGDGVFLSGSVPTEERRQAVSRVVAELLPEHEVHNQVTVVAVSEP